MTLIKWITTDQIRVNLPNPRSPSEALAQRDHGIIRVPFSTQSRRDECNFDCG
jgi:hypothetical protein